MIDLNLVNVAYFLLRSLKKVRGHVISLYYFFYSILQNKIYLIFFNFFWVHL